MVSFLTKGYLSKYKINGTEKEQSIKYMYNFIVISH